MATRNYIYTNKFPYHIWNRTNNRIPYPIPLAECWRIYSYCLDRLVKEFNFKIYAFVMMNNHYHLLGQCSEAYPLNIVMHHFQMHTTNIINKSTNRINRLYGGPYQSSLIKDEYHYSNVFKYILQNPMRANLVTDFSKYKYSSHYIEKPNFKLLLPTSSIHSHIPLDENKYVKWLNELMKKEDELKIRKGLRKKEFKVANVNRKLDVINFKLV